MKALSRMKKTATALSVALALAVSGAPAAHAVIFDFQANSLMLAIFGGDNEHIVNLGDVTALTSGPATTFNIDPGAIAAVSTNLGAGGLKYALLGLSGNATFPNGFLKTLSGKPSGSFSQTQIDQWVPTAAQTATFLWSNELALVGNDTSVTLGKNDAGSFTARFGINGSLGGAFSVPQQVKAGVLGTIIMSELNAGNGAQSLVGDMGQAILSADGLTFTIGSSVAPVPLPAAGILFATGLLGLVGISRRPKAN